MRKMGGIMAIVVLMSLSATWALGASTAKPVKKSIAHGKVIIRTRNYVEKTCKAPNGDAVLQLEAVFGRGVIASSDPLLNGRLLAIRGGELDLDATKSAGIGHEDVELIKPGTTTVLAKGRFDFAYGGASVLPLGQIRLHPATPGFGWEVLLNAQTFLEIKASGVLEQGTGWGSKEPATTPLISARDNMRRCS